MRKLPIYGIENFQVQLCYANGNGQSNSFSWNAIAVFIDVVVEGLQFRKYLIQHTANGLRDFLLHIACPLPLLLGSCDTSRSDRSDSAAPRRKNPPRISADGFSSGAIHFDQNTMVDRTSQPRWRLFIHMWKIMFPQLENRRAVTCRMGRATERGPSGRAWWRNPSARARAV